VTTIWKGVSSRGLRILARWRFLTGVCTLLLSACSVGREHTSDRVLEERFSQYEKEFEAFRAEIEADEKFELIGIGELRYAGTELEEPVGLSDVERLGLPRERWERYQSLLRELGIAQVIKGKSSVEFKVDGESISNGSSSKGYEYSLVPPEHQRESLDSYRISDEDKDKFGGYYVAKPLKGNWYLYLFVNG
jgi:hypothetical protein